MTFYSLTGQYTLDGFSDLRRNGAVRLENRLAAAIADLGGRLVQLYFLGARFDVYLVIEAPASAAITLILPMITSKAFLPGVELARLITAEEADISIA